MIRKSKRLQGSQEVIHASSSDLDELLAWAIRRGKVGWKVKKEIHADWSWPWFWRNFYSIIMSRERELPK
jgi:hypothetical protein